jgi:hypothetical protein
MCESHSCGFPNSLEPIDHLIARPRLRFYRNLDDHEMAIQPTPPNPLLAATLKTPIVTSLVDSHSLPIVDGVTSDRSPIMSGTGKAGDTITLYDGAYALSSVIVAANGTWSIQPLEPMAPGSHGLYVVETNKAGDTSLPSDRSWIIVSAAYAPSPVITNVVNEAGPAQHTIPNNGLTNDSHPTISGTGVPGNLVNVYVDTVNTNSYVTVDVNGNWTFTLPAMSDGLHTLTAAQANATQDRSPLSSPWSFTVDTSPVAKPVVNVPTDDSGVPITGTTTDAHPTISGTGKAGDTITMYDGATVIGSVVIGTDGKWSLKPAKDLSTGTHDIYVIETNPAGTSSPESTHTSISVNTTNPAPVIVNIVDAVGPIQGTVAAGGVTDDPRPTISGTGIPGNTVYLYQNGVGCGDTKVGTDGKWSFKLLSDLSSGAHDMTATQFAAGQVQSVASNHWSITVDTSVPVKPVITGLTDDAGASIPAGSSTVNAHPTVSGTAKAGDIVTLYDGATAIGSVKAGTDGKWTIKPSKDLSVGSHDVYAIDTNAAGTPSAQSTHVAFTVISAVAAAPVIANVVDATSAHTGTVPAGGVTADAQPTVSGTGIPGNTVWLFQNGVGCGDTKVLANGTWSIKLSGPMSAGVHDMTATQFAAGQPQSVASNHWSITIDTSVPVKPVITGLTDDAGLPIAAGSTTPDVHPNISGTGKAGDIVTVYDGAKVLGSVKVDGNGKWTLKTPDLSTGSHDVYAIDTNAAGTPSAQSDHVAFTVGTIAPTVPVITSVIDAVGPITGAIAQNGVTDDSRPTVTVGCALTVELPAGIDAPASSVRPVITGLTGTLVSMVKLQWFDTTLCT